MHIKTEPCPEAGTQEVHHVFLCEDDDEETIVSVIGHVTRADDGADQWTLRTSSAVVGPSKPMIFTAKDVDQLRKVMEAQFTHIKVNASRLALPVMSEFVDDLMDPIIALAEKTDSIAGLINALVMVIARVSVVHAPDAAHDEMITTFADELRKHMTYQATARAAQKQFADVLHKKFQEATGKESISDLFKVDSDDDTPKH